MDNKTNANVRPPIVTVMGHVDHGKTTLLDAIRKTNVVALEHGGITQHIGAYQIIHNQKPITFIDTPGHAAFEKMRLRGAEIADIVVLVVAANDGVKPQTVEAIKHIKSAHKPTIVAITKTDLPDVNLDKVKASLQKEDIVVESYGGKVPVVEVAAPKGKGIDELLEMISLVWHLDPKESLPRNPLEAVVVESFLDKNRGAIVSVIVKEGTLKTGQRIQMDSDQINIKALIDDNGKNIQEAPPGKPIEILGFKKVMEIGSILREQNIISKEGTQKQAATLAEIIEKSQSVKSSFKVIIKADVAGSLEAIEANLPPKILVISDGVGEVNQTDVAFAKAAQAPILAFNVKVPNSAKQQAEREKVVIREYKVIYELLEDMEDVAIGFEAAKQELKITGRAKIVAEFNIEGQKVAGCMVTGGKIKNGDTVLVKQTEDSGGKEVKITSLKRFKKDISQVNSGQDCGIVFSPNVDFTIGSIIESFGQN